MPSTAFHAMGSKIKVVIDGDTSAAPVILGEVRGWFLAWEACLSRFRPESELNRLNRQNGRPVYVSQTLWDVLQAALDAARQTGGLITPSILPALEAAGYDKTFSEVAAGESSAVPDREDANDGRPHAQALLVEEIQADFATRKICIPAGIRLDLGGFAKGWAADESARRLGQIAPALVDAGGDIAVSGPRADGSPWPLGIAHPQKAGQNLASVQLQSGGLATSGRNYRHWARNGQLQHHLIDPRRNQPAVTDVVTASVVASSALAAETAAKMALVLGSQGGEKWLEEHHLSGVLALENGDVRYMMTAADSQPCISAGRGKPR